MTGNRALIRQLARSRKIQAAARDIAGRVAQEASRIDPDGEFVVRDELLDVAGLLRNTSTVTNEAEDSARKEFGGAKQSGWRPLGRAARSVGR